MPCPEFSARSFIQKELQNHGLIQETNGVSEKAQLNQIQKVNKTLIDDMINRIMPVYFEHFFAKLNMHTKMTMHNVKNVKKNT